MMFLLIGFPAHWQRKNPGTFLGRESKAEFNTSGNILGNAGNVSGKTLAIEIPVQRVPDGWSNVRTVFCVSCC